MKKLFSIFCCLLLSAGMVTQAANQTFTATWAQNTIANVQLAGATRQVTGYRWVNGNKTLSLYFLEPTGHSYRYNNKVCPPKGQYTITNTYADNTVTSGYADMGDGTQYNSTLKNGSTTYRLYQGTVKVYEGVDGPYITTTSLSLANNAFSQIVSGTHSFTIGTNATYRTVTVQSDNTTMGTVSYVVKSGYIFEVDGTYAKHWKNNSVYTLTASPKSGYHFVEWKKGSTQISTNATTDVTITANATYTAYFEADGGTEYTISTAVSPAGAGTVTGAGTYYENSSATLTATSSNSHLYFFDHWLKGSSTYAGGATISPTVTGDATYTAVFRTASAGDITIVSNYGTATGAGHYAGGTAVQLGVTANDGYVFEQWSDGNTDNPRTVYVDGNATYTAQFRDLNAALLASFSWDDDDVSVEQYGDGNSLCNSFYSPAGKNFYLVYAKSNSRNTKNYLQVSIQSTQSQMWGDLSFFKVGDYPVVSSGLTTGSCNYGTYWYWTLDQTNVCVAYGYDSYDLGMNILGSYLCDKSGNAQDASDQSNYLSVTEGMTCKITVGKNGDPYIRLVRNSDQQVLVSVGEAQPKYNVSITAPTNGTVTVAYNDGSAQSFTSGSRSIAEGTVLTVTTTPAADYHFNAWTGNGAASVTVDADKTIGATFAQNDYFLNATYGAGGASVTRSDNGNNLTVKRAGNTVTLSATAATGYTFLSWGGTDAAKVSNNIFTFPANGTHNTTYNVQATFQTITYDLTYNGLEGATHSNPATYTVKTETITLTAPSARTGYTFTGWTCGGTPITQIALGSTGDKTITANWTANTYYVSFAAGEGSGSAMSNQTFTYGETKPLTGNTYTGPAVTVTYDYDGADGGNSIPSATVYGVFYRWTDGANTYDDEESVSNLTATNGATVALTAEWDEPEDEITVPSPTKTGYTFVKWEGIMGGMGMTQTAGSSFIPNASFTLTAQWTINKYAITYLAGANGTGSVAAGEKTHGEDFTLSSSTFTRSGYAQTGWSLTDGGAKAYDLGGTYTGNAALTLYPVWTALSSDITLCEDCDNDHYNTFKANDGRSGVNVTYTRTFVQGRWSTLCLPFNVTSGQMTTLKMRGRVYEFRYATGNANNGNQVTLYFSAPSSLEAGKCYIVNANNALANRSKSAFVFNSVTINLDADKVADLTVADAYDGLDGYSDPSEKDNKIELVGTLRKGTLIIDESGNTYMGLKENKIYYPNTTSGSTVLAYRGVFRSINGASLEDVMERVRIVVDGEDAGELEVVNGELQAVPEVRKFIRDGVLYIEREGVIYDAAGQRVE